MEQFENIEVYQDGQLIVSQQIQYTEADILRLEFEKYQTRKIDGEKAFLSLAADLRIKKISGEIDEVTFNSIEEILLPVRSEVVLGQWKTALNKLNEINPQSIGVDLYSKIQNTLQNYILENY